MVNEEHRRCQTERMLEFMTLLRENPELIKRGAETAIYYTKASCANCGGTIPRGMGMLFYHNRQYYDICPPCFSGILNGDSGQTDN